MSVDASGGSRMGSSECESAWKCRVSAEGITVCLKQRQLSTSLNTMHVLEALAVVRFVRLLKCRLDIWSYEQ